MNKPEDVTTHQEVQKSFQTTFGNDVKSLVATFEDFGNPFLDEGGDLVALDTKEVARSLKDSRVLKAKANHSVTSLFQSV